MGSFLRPAAHFAQGGRQATAGGQGTENPGPTDSIRARPGDAEAGSGPGSRGTTRPSGHLARPRPGPGHAPRTAPPDPSRRAPSGLRAAPWPRRQRKRRCGGARPGRPRAPAGPTEASALLAVAVGAPGAPLTWGRATVAQPCPGTGARGQAPGPSVATGATPSAPCLRAPGGVASPRAAPSAGCSALSPCSSGNWGTRGRPALAPGNGGLPCFLASDSCPLSPSPAKPRPRCGRTSSQVGGGLRVSFCVDTLLSAESTAEKGGSTWDGARRCAGGSGGQNLWEEWLRMRSGAGVYLSVSTANLPCWQVEEFVVTEDCAPCSNFQAVSMVLFLFLFLLHLAKYTFVLSFRFFLCSLCPELVFPREYTLFFSSSWQHSANNRALFIFNPAGSGACPRLS